MTQTVIEHVLSRLKSLGIEDVFNTYTAPPMAVALHDNTKTLHHTSHRSGPHLDSNNTAIDRDRIGNQVHVTGCEPKGAP